MSPSIASTEILKSPSRVTSAVLPSGVIATWLGPDFASAIATVSSLLTSLPLILNTDTVPAARLATKARLPCRLIETPAGDKPVSSVAMILGGEALRSITDILLSGIDLVASLGSIFIADVTSARPSSGVIATETGGPTTLAGTSISATILGGDCDRSITAIVSASGVLATSLTPFTRTALPSLADTASCACTGPPKPTAAATRLAARFNFPIDVLPIRIVSLIDPSLTLITDRQSLNSQASVRA